MNKKQYNSIWAGSLALLLLAGSCSKSDETAAPEPSDGRIVVRALASDSGQTPSFDRFGLYIVQKAAEGSEALAGERLHANVEFTLARATPMSRHPPLRFQEQRSCGSTSYAYAPYRETALEAGAVTLPLALAADQQDDAAYTAADLRFSKRTNYAAVTGDVAMEFAHAMSRIDIVLKAGYGYTLDDFASAGVVLKGLKNEGAFSFVDGGSTTSGAAADIAPHGTLTRQDDCLRIVGHRHSTECRSRRTARRNYGERRTLRVLASKMFILQSGKRHTLTLVLSRSFEGVTVQTDVTVTDWLPGGDESIVGEEILPPPGTTVEDGDGNSYGIIRIGRQYWMDENLHTTKYNDGTAIAHITDGKEWMAAIEGAYCSYDNDDANAARYGLLYNRAAVSTHKLCPEGWHVPTVDDWNKLGSALGGTLNDFDSWVGVASKLKATAGWPAARKLPTRAALADCPAVRSAPTPTTRRRPSSTTLKRTATGGATATSQAK
ncbi:MAG: FISUMP domain-containing protein [Alistipes sp.]